MPQSDEPRSGRRFLGDALAANVAAYRKAAVPPMRQQDLADRMTLLGHPWTQAVASMTETATRNVTVDELLALAVALGVTPAELLDPGGITGTDERDADLWDLTVLAPRLARSWTAGKTVLRLRELSGAELEEAGLWPPGGPYFVIEHVAARMSTAPDHSELDDHRTIGHVRFPKDSPVLERIRTERGMPDPLEVAMVEDEALEAAERASEDERR